MENLFTHFDLTEFPQIDRKEEIIETQKKVKKILYLKLKKKMN